MLVAGAEYQVGDLANNQAFPVVAPPGEAHTELVRCVLTERGRAVAARPGGESIKDAGRPPPATVFQIVNRAAEQGLDGWRFHRTILVSATAGPYRLRQGRQLQLAELDDALQAKQQ